MSNEFCGVLRPEEEKAIRQAIPKRADRALLEAAWAIEQGGVWGPEHRAKDWRILLAARFDKARNPPTKNGVQATQIQGIK